jgi:membrane-bound metal-dependent hydrolase YbcI (DUF457 family)
VFIGHNAVGLIAKKAAPRASLGVLMAAAMLLDLIWPIFVLTGIEHVRIAPGATLLSPLDFTDYPWTHSLALACAWGVAFALVYFAIRRYGRGAIIIALAVVSHWVLDWLTHRPDLPLWPHGPRVGLGLWNHPIVSIGIESALFAIGILVYRDVAKPIDRIGSIAFWAFIVFLVALYVVMAAGIPPKTVQQIGWAGVAGWILPFWAAWFDRHRMPEE